RGPVVGAAPADPVPAVGTRAPGAADRLIAAERAARDGERRPEQVREATPQAVGAVATGTALAADRLVAGERAARDRGRAPALVEDRAGDALARAGAARGACAANGPA